jgi:hypothetical protein
MLHCFVVLAAVCGRLAPILFAGLNAGMLVNFACHPRIDTETKFAFVGLL